jgi:hypothetical protein
MKSANVIKITKSTKKHKPMKLCSAFTGKKKKEGKKDNGRGRGKKRLSLAFISYISPSLLLFV